MKNNIPFTLILLFWGINLTSAQSWTRIQLDPYKLVDGIFFHDTGIIIDYFGDIIKSNDYFHSFTIDTSYATRRFDALSFSNRSTGCISSANIKGGMLRTFDGGDTWSPMPVGPDSGQYLGDVLYFTSPDTGFGAYSFSCTINTTLNGGLHWTHITNSTIGGECEEVLRIKVLKDSIIYLLANNSPGPGGGWLLYIIRSTDYGHTWSKLSEINDAWAYGDMYFLDDTSIIVSARNEILKSVNGGVTFNTVMYNAEGSDNYINSVKIIAFSGHDTGYAISAGGLYRTYDAGDTWINTNFSFDSMDFPNSVWFLAMASSQKIILGCDNGDIYETDFETTGEESVSQKNPFTIYPNPTNNKLFCNIVTKQKSYLQILAIDGREVMPTDVIQQNRFEVDVSTLSAGLYFLVIQNDEGRVVRKFVKE